MSRAPQYTGTAALARLAVRRDRWLLPWWAVALPLIPVGLGRGIAATAPTAADLARYARLSRSNGTFTALYGALQGDSLGPLTVWRCGFLPVVFALISALTVIRHTRSEEEAGRRELVGAAAVGRRAPLAAALLVTLAADLVAAAVVTLTLTAWGRPAAGSLAFGLAVASAGWVFAAVGALVAQLTTGGGAARGIAVSAVGVAYLLRAVGDGVPAVAWLSWLSPVHWSHAVQPYAGDRWWVLAVPLAVTVAVGGPAPALAERRDLGAGLLPPRQGPATAPAGLNSPLGLARRLHRGSAASWLAGIAVVGVVFGGLAHSVGDLLGENASMRDLFGRLGGRSGAVDSFLAAAMGILGLLAAAQAVQAALRLRAEEVERRAEPVLAAPVRRTAWTASHLPFVLLAPALSLVAGGAATGAVHGARDGDLGRQVARCVGGALLQVPAVWVVAGVALAAFGLLPRATAALGWTAVAGCLLIGFFGALLQFDARVLDLSPFTHVPHYPGGAVTALPVVGLGAVAALLAGLGLLGAGRRDMPQG